MLGKEEVTSGLFKSPYGVLLFAEWNSNDLVSDPGLAFTLAQHLCRSRCGLYFSVKNKSSTPEPVHSGKGGVVAGVDLSLRAKVHGSGFLYLYGQDRECNQELGPQRLIPSDTPLLARVHVLKFPQLPQTHLAGN